MAGYLSFCVIIGSGEIIVRDPYFHERTAEDAGLQPNEYTRAVWAKDDDGASLDFGKILDWNSGRDEAWYKAIVLAQYPTRRALEDATLPTHLLTPAEQPNADLRLRAAEYIPPRLLTRPLTPEEEPDARVRWCVVQCIPAERIERMLTRADEPDTAVRRRAMARILAKHINRRLTLDEEPDLSVRRLLEQRIIERMN